MILRLWDPRILQRTISIAGWPTWLLPTVIFVLALLVALRASAWFIQALESLSDLLDLSPSTLGLLSALGGNIPNYVASLVAFAEGQMLVGLGIIIGSNIYNIAIILGIATFATPGRRGIHITRIEAPDVRTVGIAAVLISMCTLIAIMPLATPQMNFPGLMLFLGADLGALGIFGLFMQHSLRRITVRVVTAPWQVAAVARKDQGRQRLPLVFGLTALTLLLALGGVIVMVQSGQVAAVALHLPTPILSLLILAVATSLPNTVVAYQLARSGRTVTCVEEIFSSTSINLALGSIVPLLIWHVAFHDALLLFLDAPLMVALSLIALAGVYRRQIGRWSGGALLLCYALWIVIHVVV